MQRKFISDNSENSEINWDQLLPDLYLEEWGRWTSSLVSLSNLKLSRCYTHAKFGTVVTRELHVFSDASQEAIGYVMYLKSISDTNDVHVSFVIGDSKVAPKGAESIPRLELCAAVEAAKAAFYVESQFTFEISSVYFYTDSEVVLGYIRNETRQFTRYVSRRVDMIKRVSDSKQWQYIPTHNNPADIASRPTDSKTLIESMWFTGPKMLWEVGHVPLSIDIPLDLPEQDFKFNHVLLSVANDIPVFTELLLNACHWGDLLNTVKFFLTAFWSWADITKQNKGFHLAPRGGQCAEMAAPSVILKVVQSSTYGDVLGKLTVNGKLPSNHALGQLCPFIDQDGIIRVGGRLRQSNVPMNQKHPIILPPNHAVTLSILEHYHSKTKHQGRHITQGAITEAGFYINHGKQVIKNFIFSCVTCRKLRGNFENQLMADLPPERSEMSPPFTNAGCDVFGPWKIKEGCNTRRSNAEKKCWAILFTCMYSRAVHIEPLPGLDVSSFKNAFRRFVSVRGPCHTLRSDQGTNFIGASRQDNEAMKAYLSDNDCRWEFNPPHSSHFGGVWERKIGQIRRAMDGALLNLRSKLLSRDELHTLLSEAAAIVNATPLWEVSSDPNDPQPLSPSMILTMKSNHCVRERYDFPSDLGSYGMRRWRRVQHIADQFWKLWRANYLQELQVRRKWQKERPSLSVGDIVLIRDKNVQRNLWPFGKIESVKFSHDGLVRSVMIRVARSSVNGIKFSYYERPVSELVLLVRYSSSA